MREDELNRIELIAAGNQEALAAVFGEHRDRLRRMVQLRLDRRLQGRIDPSDVLQEAYLDISKRAVQYANRKDMPFFLWLRLITAQKLLEIHRRHLGTQQRDVTREISICDIGPEVSSHILASQLLGGLSSAGNKMARAEQQAMLENALNELEPLDREVLTLRHFEELNNGDVSSLLGISKTAASNRYIRALSRLKQRLATIPGFLTPD